MRTYAIYENLDNNFVSVKQGFSWPAFFFGWMWMLTKRLWKEAAIYIGIFFFIVVLLDDIPSLLAIIIYAFCGFIGNELVEKNLRQRGYKKVGEVKTSSMFLHFFVYLFLYGWLMLELFPEFLLILFLVSFLIRF